MSLFRADQKFERFEDVTPEFLQREKVHLLLCDLDNTLRLRSEKSPTDTLARWIKACRKAGVKIVVISNNGHRKTIQKFCRPLKVDCVWWAKKPFSAKLTATMTKHHCVPQETAMLGDKWSTDILAAKFAKVRAWQVAHRKDVVCI